MKGIIIHPNPNIGEVINDLFCLNKHQSEYFPHTEYAVKEALKDKPDFMVIDPLMSHVSGVEGYEQITKVHGEIATVFYSHLFDDFHEMPESYRKIFERLDELSVPREWRIEADGLKFYTDVTDKIIPELERQYAALQKK